MARILLVGCGKMGEAILRGWLKNGIAAEEISIIDPFADVEGFDVVRDVSDFAGDPEFVVLAFKPQSAEELLPVLAKFKRAIYISIMAGKTIQFLSNKLLSMEVVRAMPNLPATVGEGYTALFAPAQVQADKRAEIEEMFTACGKTTWLETEAQMDAITSLSGSGPAYVFLFAEAMVNAAVEFGLPRELAKEAALQTIAGGAEFARQSDMSLAELQAAVASKGGTTQAALDVFYDRNIMKSLVENAMRAAKKRSEELAE